MLQVEIPSYSNLRTFFSCLPFPLSIPAWYSNRKMVSNSGIVQVIHNTERPMGEYITEYAYLKKKEWQYVRYSLTETLVTSIGTLIYSSVENQTGGIVASIIGIVVLGLGVSTSLSYEKGYNTVFRVAPV